MKIKLLILSLILITPFLGNNLGNILFIKDINGMDNLDEKDNIEIFDVNSYVLESFKKYNKNIKIKTVKKFIEVCDSFKINDNIKTLTAQICLESGAKQSLNGKTLESSGNALGISQVTPYTAYLFFKNVISKNDKLLSQLGGSDYKNILITNDSKLRRKKVQKWLCNETNNLIMYGYLMNHCIIKYGGLKNSLVVYSKGPYFLRKSLKSNVKLDTLHYISSIKKIEKTLTN
tara:strand:+ start:2839 stop:3534 length:696 start_codon:yes stop_codon:yes gene_type:complete